MTAKRVEAMQLAQQLLFVASDTPVGHGPPDAAEYQRLAPETTVLYRVLQRYLGTFLSSSAVCSP